MNITFDISISISTRANALYTWIKRKMYKEEKYIKQQQNLYNTSSLRPCHIFLLLTLAFILLWNVNKKFVAIFLFDDPCCLQQPSGEYISLLLQRPIQNCVQVKRTYSICTRIEQTTSKIEMKCSGQRQSSYWRPSCFYDASVFVILLGPWLVWLLNV